MKKFLSVILILLLLSSCTKPIPEKPIELPPEIPSTEEPEPAPLTVDLPSYFYEFRPGVVRYTSIDPESDFAKSAVNFVKAYLTKQYSENEEIESFEITDVEVDINDTNWHVNTWLYNQSIKSEDILNNFLIIRYRSNVKMKEGLDYYSSFPDQDLSEPIEGHIWAVYDSENKYNYTGLEGHKWKHFNGNLWSWNDTLHTEEEMFYKFYSRKTDHLPLYAYLEEDDDLTVLAAEQTKENLKNALELDKNVISYEIFDAKANINHTNFAINTGFRDIMPGHLVSYFLCVNISWKMDLVDNPSIYKDSVYGGFHYDYDDIPIEHSLYLLFDGGDWITVGSSTFPFDAFDDLTEEDLIEAINGLG